MTEIYRNGYYNDVGYWQRTKHCFMSCGNRCDCGPPGGFFYSAMHDKSLQKKPLESKPDARSTPNARR